MEISICKPTFINVDDSSPCIVDLKHLFCVPTPHDLAPFNITLKRNPSDLLVRQTEASLQDLVYEILGHSLAKFLLSQDFYMTCRPDGGLRRYHPLDDITNSLFSLGLLSLQSLQFPNGRIAFDEI